LSSLCKYYVAKIKISHKKYQGNNVNKTKTLISTLTLAVCAASLNVNAANKAPGSGPNPFSDCGIGAALFKDTKWAAVSSNVIWDIGTTAVTSATASPETCTSANVVAAKFIIDNYDNIVEEIADGSGDHLTSMYSVLGCGSSAQVQMTASIRNGMVKATSEVNYQEQSLVEKSSALYSMVNNSSVVGNCAAI
jgi:hypothetical protein